MKKTAIILTVIAVVYLSSCIDQQLLDKAEVGDLTKDKIYSDITQADEVLSDLYGRVRNPIRNSLNNYGSFSGGAYLDCGTSYGDSQIGWSTAIPFKDGTWNSSNCWFNSGVNISDGRIYSVNYTNIRAAWLFLENIEKVPFDPESDYGAINQQQKIGEAQFLLAWQYHELISFYGGVTLVKSSLTTSSEEIMAPRNTYDECVDYVAELCDKAAEKLPLSWPSNQIGRATKGAALALKARVLLYAASPLFNNPDKPDAQPWRGKYDPEKWNKAAAAAYEVIKLNMYSLYPDISRLFVMNTNSEAIFQRMSPMNKGIENNDGMPGIGTNNTNVGRNAATYNMFKQYKVLKSGVAYDQDNPASGFNLQDPYKNLDPRFYRDMVFNGAWTIRQPVVQLWAKGQDGTVGANNLPSINTFLAVGKFMDPLINATLSANTWHNMLYIRYAEVLLNYAEAMNEAFSPEVDGLGNGMTARAAVNLIRQRTKYPTIKNYKGYTGGMPDFPSGLTRDQFRKEIHQERKVELCFEYQLFFDLRRWKEPIESQQNGYWLIPTRNTNKTFSYSLAPKKWAFSTAWYLMPIDDNQVQMNAKILQNPGWTGATETEN